MNILIVGAAGFIGKNLVSELLQGTNNLWLYDRKGISYDGINFNNSGSVTFIEGNYCEEDYVRITKGMDIVYHLISTTTPATRAKMETEIVGNILPTVNLLNACVENGVKRIIFLSSGGTVYGKDVNIPIKEDQIQNPICAYGVQKLAIEKILQLYYYQYGLDYRVIRLSNPYGPYQNPLSGQGVISAFTYSVLADEEVRVFGDGSVIRDYIYITDAVKAIVNIADGEDENKIYNVGSGEGKSINDIIACLKNLTQKEFEVVYYDSRKADVPINVLDVTRYEKKYGKISNVSLEDGMVRTMAFIKETMF